MSRAIGRLGANGVEKKVAEIIQDIARFVTVKLVRSGQRLTAIFVCHCGEISRGERVIKVNSISSLLSRIKRWVTQHKQTLLEYHGSSP